MAKLNYSKPMFSICPIPLTAGGTAGGCSIEATNADYVCPVNILGDLVFADSAGTDCDTFPQDGETNICYTVPISDYNVYNS